mmetsp:Transcript_25418/g.62538  ORF Transcript_25418/g.62538 Transcript_25418/m.62538 type:complete len:166 (-) Transcript_25418:95-592(-)|eukprot:CAMPEP_0113603714 /NCGR_PEP_ID=MMETSP0017_2-20120614/1421_1 /TAXON_ID=2856 /ORGANISM="Cylindrotheca closterium" /LENGTH=165 /DNA_ID=CAMNT_0000512115 /DNA_START=28 /DNA_END=525 /DNA_ORIENTATION=- /assembly_acc=CAM_ASM_000147
MGVRTPFYFVICIDDEEDHIDSEPQPAIDAELYNYYYGDEEDEADHDDDLYSTTSSCHELNDTSSLLDDIDSVYGEDDECDFDVDFPNYSKRETLPFQQYNATLPESLDYFDDYEDDEYSLASEEWEETINDVRSVEADETTAVLVDKRPRQRYGRRETSSPDVL